MRQRLSAPGPHHAHLGRLAGNYDVEMTFFATPGAEPVRSEEMTATINPVMGGRWLLDTAVGTLAGRAYERHGLFGFDAQSARFERVTWDNSSPGVMVYRGLPGQVGDEELTFYGEYTEAGFSAELLGQTVQLRQTLTFEEGGVNRLRLYVRPPAASEYLNQEQIYIPQQ
jgi:uncharacterized protein DUF1579